MAELTSEQLEQTSWNTLPTDTVKQALDENHRAILNASHFEQKDPEKEQAEMALSIWPDEIEAIHQMKTWAYAQEIIKGGTIQSMAMFRMAGDVIKAKAGNSQATCLVLDGSVEWYSKADMFLNNGPGNYFVTFDPPFALRMRGNGCNLVEDGPGTIGLKVYYCIQYNMSEDHKMQIFKAGIVFAQHVQVNPARLSTLAFTMQRELTLLMLLHGRGATWTNAPGKAHHSQLINALALD